MNEPAITLSDNTRIQQFRAWAEVTAQEVAKENRSRFFMQLAGAAQDAKHRNVPCCPVKPDSFVMHDGTCYAVSWIEASAPSKTMRYSAIVTDCESGLRLIAPQIICKQTNSRKGVTTRFSLTGHGSVTTQAAMNELLIQVITAPKKPTLSLSNPVTGTRTLPYHAGQAAAYGQALLRG